MKTILFLIIILNYLFAFGQQKDTTSKCDNSIDESNIEEIYESFACEQRASFPGGDTEMLKYINEHLRFPKMNIECGIEGKVYVRFVVTKTGNIEQSKVIRSADPLLDEEALRVVKSLPKWEPAKIKGEPVNSWFIVPVKFKLP
jgi:periplasmic protein TonB